MELSEAVISVNQYIMQPRFGGTGHFDRNISASSKNFCSFVIYPAFGNQEFFHLRHSRQRHDLPADGSNVQGPEQHQYDRVQRLSVRFPFTIDTRECIVILYREILTNNIPHQQSLV